MNAPDPRPMSPELLARIVHQAAKYGELYLTFDEAVSVLDFVHERPHTVVATGPGAVRSLRSFSVYVLPTLDREPSNTQPTEGPTPE